MSATMRPHIMNVNFPEEKIQRQYRNDEFARQCIITRRVTNVVSVTEISKYIENTGMTGTEIFDKCRTDKMFMDSIIQMLSINASHQWIEDRDMQLNACNATAIDCGITLEKLKRNAYCPTKYHGIASVAKRDRNDIPPADCLKAFDARISGKVSGWVFANVAFHSSKHRDKVFNEAEALCNWVKDIGSTLYMHDMFVVLIDTYDTKTLHRLKRTYRNVPELIIGNHRDIQRYFIEYYYTSA